MPICHCNVTVVPPVAPCSGCLLVNDILIGCADGPLPCGTTVQVDLAANNTLTACTGIPVWSIKYFDPIAFTNVSITQAGIITFDTTNIYKAGKEFLIIYQVDCPGSLLRAEGDIKVCFKNPCTSPTCKNCNPCTGNCITGENGDTNATITSAGCPDVINNFDLKTISSYADCGTGITYELTYSPLIFGTITELNGVLTFKVLPAAVSGTTYIIYYEMTCPDFQIKVSGSLTVLVKTLCHDVVCIAGQICDECTGLCIPIPPEIAVDPGGQNEISIQP